MHTEKYSPKSYVLNFRTQISSSQSEERTMVLTREKKNDTSNQNRERCFLTCEKNDTSNQKPQRCVSFAPKFPPFIAACSAASHTFNEKSFTQRVFLAKKVKNISEMEWNSFVCFTVDKENGIESQRNNSGKGKTERDVSFCCAFCRSYFAILLKFTYLQLCNENKQAIPLFCTAHPLLHITLRHPRWRRFFPLERKEQSRAPFAELKLLFAKIMPQIS